jgi:leucyl aminopeptidase
LDIRFNANSATDISCDLLVLGVGTDLTSELAALDAQFEGHLLPWAQAHTFEGKTGQTLSVPSFGRVKARDLLLVGVGERSIADLRKAGAVAGRTARTKRLTSIALDFAFTNHDLAAAAAISAGTANYAYEVYQHEDNLTPSLDTLILTGLDDSPEAQLVATRAATLIKHQNITRDLVNAPAAEIYPESLAQHALTLAELPNVEVEVWDYERCLAENCVGIVAVGQGSDRKPCLIHVRYRPPQAKAHVALVGKGVTFDAGGLSIKPSNGMLTMRCDMGGAGTVVGILGAAAELELPVAIDGFIGAAENMLSGNSYKLGDILRYRNGVTVEVRNTDAEGRLVMADCLIRACQVEGVSTVLDFATLTGACVVALGSSFSGLFTSDEDLADSLRASADEAGEGLWRLPLHPAYRDDIKGEWGQIKNVGGREAGASTAAHFLEYFVDGPKWAHIDIAGPAFLDKPRGGFVAGATGQMVRSTVQWLASLGND